GEKKAERDTGWLGDGGGHVGKMLPARLNPLPSGYRYKIVFMRRKLKEVLASQREMLIRRGKPADASGDAKMAEYFTSHLHRVESWLAEQPNVDVLYVSYNELMQEPEAHCARVAEFLGLPLDASRMASAAWRSLSRQRR